VKTGGFVQFRKSDATKEKAMVQIRLEPVYTINCFDVLDGRTSMRFVIPLNGPELSLYLDEFSKRARKGDRSSGAFVRFLDEKGLGPLIIE
jgi:hypothetical protein